MEFKLPLVWSSRFKRVIFLAIKNRRELHSTPVSGFQWGLLQFRLPEFLPIIQVVEIDRVLAGTGIVGNTTCAEDVFAGAVIMKVAFDGAIQLVDIRFVEPD